MTRSTLCWAALLLGACLSASAAEEKCQLQRYAELPVTMVGTQPIIAGTINGRPARFLADSGAFFSVLTERGAKRLDLRVGLPPRDIRIRGTGGSTSVGYTKVKEFTLVGFAGGRVIPNVDFLVDELIGWNQIDGIIGQNIIGTFDTEFDLANGVIRLFRAKDCERNLAYWARNQPVAEMKIGRTTPAKPHLIGEAVLNGKKIRVMFDTGASNSKLALDAAERAGVTREDDGVIAAGVARGIGPRTNENSLARFETLDLGGEVIKNARLRIGPMNLDIADMLLGADFFLSHRVYYASTQDKLFFTYNGGPVFDLGRRAQNSSVPGDSTSGSPMATPEASGLTAEELRRRGIASASRNDFDAAIADLDQAIELDGSDAEAFYQRGMARVGKRQGMLAMQDFDAALRLRPTHVDALIARGTMHVRRQSEAQAAADFKAALEHAANDPAVSFRIAQAYQVGDNLAASVRQLNEWVAAHPKDDLFPSALASRCMARALLGRELEAARDDCDTALKKGPRNSNIYDSRGLVWLQLGNLDKAIADYQEALDLQPKKASSLYGLGLAEIKQGRKESGERNVQEALALNPEIATGFRRIGLTP